MADKSNLIITMNDHESGKAQQKTITDINPQASSSKLATWGQMTAALSKDGYVKTTRIDRTECDVVKTERTISSVISLTGSTVTLEGGVYKIQVPQASVTGNPKSLTISIDSPQFNPLPKFMPYLVNTQITGGFNFYSWRLELRIANPRITCYFTQTNAPEVGETVKGTIIVPADETYAELRVPFEATIIQGA